MANASTMADGDPQLDRLVGEMIERVNLQEGRESSAQKAPHRHAGPLTAADLAQLSLQCTVADSTSGPGFAGVEGDQLVTLVDLLDRHVNKAIGLHVIPAALSVLAQAETASSQALDKWLAHHGAHQLATLRAGLEAAAILVYIATSPGVDRRAMSEDAIGASITLMRMHLVNHLVPALNQTGHLLAETKSLDVKAEEASPSKKRRRSSTTGNAAAKELKKVYKLLSTTISQHVLLSDRLEKLVHDVPLDSQQILFLANSCLTALEIDCNATSPDKAVPPGLQLQLSAMSLVTAVFTKYPMHRETILEDLFPLMLRLPTGKRSLRAYAVRYASVQAPLALSSFNAQLVGPLLSNGAEPHFIQMITALVMSMVQSCVTRPYYQPVENADPPSNKLISGLTASHAIADCFFGQLLKRCNRKGSTAEFRPILVNLVEDLLLVSTIPEYPAAEALLGALLRRLHHDLNLASPSLKKTSSTATTSLETTYMNTAFDLLGKICSVEAKLLATHKQQPLHPTTGSRSSTPPSDQDVHVACYCGKDQDEYQFLIACDGCRTAYHGLCVGCHRDNLPDEWWCDACRLGRLLEREKLKHEATGEDGFIDEAYALEHSLLANLSLRQGSLEVRQASQFHLARWMDHLDRKSGQLKKQPMHIIGTLLESWENPCPGSEPLTETGMNRLLVAVAAQTSPLVLTFRNQVSFLIRLMGDESSHAMRKLSLKAIEKTVEGDPQLMMMPIITRAVSKRLLDDSISVREAAVSLVGAYVIKSAAVASSFQPSLLSCLKDVGVSVRKRAIRIFQDILTTYPRYKGRSDACHAMLKIAADPKEEDAVRDLIHELFIKLWLQDGGMVVPSLAVESKSPPPDKDSTHSSPTSNQSAGPGLVTPTPPAAGTREVKAGPQKRADIAAEQMMEVVRAGGSNEHLETLLRTLLRAKSDKDKKTARKKNDELDAAQCDHLVESLFELLFSIEEQRPIRALRIGKDLAATLRTIETFAEFAPRKVLDHLDALLPYLKADNSVSVDDETDIVSATCDIIFRLTTVVGKDVASNLTSSVANDLVQITYKFGTAALESAVRAWAALVQQMEDSNKTYFEKKLLGAARTFYEYLYKKADLEDFSSQTEKVRSNTHRALAVLGLIGQYHGIHLDADTWENEVDNDNGALLEPKEFDWTNSRLACYRIFSNYLRKADSSTQCCALRALGGTFVAQPRLLLLLEQNGLIESVMSKSADVALQLESLQCWRKILLAEEKRIDGGKAKAKMDSDKTVTTAKRISGDQDGDATLFGGVLSNHSARIYEMTQDHDRRVRYASLELVGHLLRQGLLNPNETVPFLFALQGDIENVPIRSLALKLLMTEGEKRPDMLRQRICDGVKKAYDFQRAVYPKKSQVSALVEVRRGKVHLECVFSSVYLECIANSRKQRQGLFTNLLGLFEMPDMDDDQALARRRKKRKTKRGIDPNLLSYVSQILAHLPYTSAGDPLYIIHKIGSIITLQGAQILERFATVLRPIGLSSADELDEANAAEDALECAARTKFPSRTQEAQGLNSADFDIQTFTQLCQNGAALILLLRLKGFLRSLYNLSETRCLEYDPSAKERVGEKVLSKSDSTKPFDSSIPMTEKRGVVNIDSLIRQYAEFRRLMREETSFVESRVGEASSASEDNDNDDAMEEVDDSGCKRLADEM